MLYEQNTLFDLSMDVVSVTMLVMQTKLFAIYLDDVMSNLED